MVAILYSISLTILAMSEETLVANLVTKRGMGEYKASMTVRSCLIGLLVTTALLGLLLLGETTLVIISAATALITLIMLGGALSLLYLIGKYRFQYSEEDIRRVAVGSTVILRKWLKTDGMMSPVYAHVYVTLNSRPDEQGMCKVTAFYTKNPFWDNKMYIQKSTDITLEVHLSELYSR